MSSQKPFLNEEVTWVVFHVDGKEPVDMERFIRRQRGLVRTEAAILETFTLRPSHPITLLEGILLMRSSICASVIGGILKEWFPDFDFTNSWRATSSRSKSAICRYACWLWASERHGELRLFPSWPTYVRLWRSGLSPPDSSSGTISPGTSNPINGRL